MMTKNGLCFFEEYLPDSWHQKLFVLKEDLAKNSDLDANFNIISQNNNNIRNIHAIRYNLHTLVVKKIVIKAKKPQRLIYSVVEYISNTFFSKKKIE